MPAVISYPGLLACESVTYTASLGVSPGAAMVVGFPEGGAAPAAAGDLTFGDADGPEQPITLKDCRVDQMRGGLSPDGNRLVVYLLDRRWRWQVGPAPIPSEFNQLDDHGKLIPWTVRSPFQLAVILLEAMGEPEPAGGWPAAVDLPGGLAARADLALGVPAPGPLDTVVDPAADYLALGQNLPPTGTNPPVVWLGEAAAVCLARLCEQYGRAVCFDPLTDRVSVVRIGDGGGLPAGPLATTQVGVNPDEAPAVVRVVGSPTRYQPRLACRAVGRDFDGSFRPLDELTYAPGNPGDVNRWDGCVPPTFTGVKGTDRLSYEQAVRLAQETVYRCYQVVAASPVNWDPDAPAAGQAAAVVPGLGDGSGTLTDAVTNRYLLVLQGSRPEQTAPRPPDVNRIDQVTGRPFAREFYDGYSQDRPPQAFGSVHVGAALAGERLVWGNRTGFDSLGNSPANSPFYVRFTLTDVRRQVFTFDYPVYRLVAVTGTTVYRPVPLVIETGALALDPRTASPVRFAVEAAVPGGTGPKRTVVVEAVQREVIGDYAADHTATGWHTNDAYALEAGRYYAEAIAATYQVAQSLTSTYVGFVRIPVGGRVRQVTWSLSPAGYLTTASLNTEHSTTVLPYPARRRKENLPPDPLEAFLNKSGKAAGAVWAGANAVVRFIGSALSGGR